jgi:hypothetical protein
MLVAATVAQHERVGLILATGVAVVRYHPRTELLLHALRVSAFARVTAAFRHKRNRGSVGRGPVKHPDPHRCVERGMRARWARPAGVESSALSCEPGCATIGSSGSQTRCLS